MPTLVVRPVQVEELAVVLDILSEAARWVRCRGIDQWPERFPDQLIAAGIERGEVYLALDGDIPVGTLTLQWDDPRFWGKGGGAGYVHRLALLPSHRGRGLGYELLDWAESQVAASGRRYLRLDCMAENRALRAYYEAAGFQHRGDVSGESSDPCRAGRRRWTVSLYERAARVLNLAAASESAAPMIVAAQLRALEAETEGLVTLLQGLGPEAWSRPTRCSPLDVRELAAHILVSYRALARVSSQPSLGADVDQDWVTWWDYDRQEVGAWVLRLAAEQAESLRSKDDARPFATEARRAVSAAAARLSSEDPVCRPFFGTVRLSHFVVTRVVEVCVHALDLRHALGLEPRPSQDALRVTATTLRARLGSEPPAVWDELRFVLVGTGREPLGDDELHSLGSLAGRFPLIA